MDAGGRVGFGTTPSSPYQVKIYGDVRFDNSGYNGILIGSAPNYSKGLIPTSHNSGYIGLSDKNFYYGYFRYLKADGKIVLTSDEKVKKNKKRIYKTLDKIKSVNAYSYDLICADTISDYNQIGFMAQEMITVFPEVVEYDTVRELYGINYIAMIPVLLESIKEQQAIIDDLAKEVQKNKSKNKNAEIGEVGQSILYQNSPNPFTEITEIAYEIAETVQNAMLNIYNMNGTQLKSIAINDVGSGKLIVNGNELGAGMYMYALIADGIIVDTKNMVLTD